jgi:hypothetical protein
LRKELAEATARSGSQSGRSSPSMSTDELSSLPNSPELKAKKDPAYSPPSIHMTLSESPHGSGVGFDLNGSVVSQKKVQ